MPKVTVGVSAYNRKDYLRECLKALGQQTWRDMEVIVVDDGSSDGTGEMMAAEFPEVKYFYKENGGDGSAKNFAADRADSDFIAFNDSDDLLLPDAVERLVEPLLARPDACAYGQYVLIDAAGAEQKTRQKMKEYPSGRIVAALVEHVIIPGTGVMYPLKGFREAGKFDESMRVGHDYKLALELAARHEFFALNRIISKRRRHASNISSADYDKIRVLRDLVAEFCRTHAGDPDLTPELVKKRLSRYELTLAREARRENRGEELIQAHLAEALKLDFSWKALWRAWFW